MDFLVQNFLSSSMVLSALRYVLTLGFGALVAKGYADGAYSEQIVGGILGLGTAAYGAWSRRPSAVVRAALALPDVASITHAETGVVAVAPAQVAGK